MSGKTYKESYEKYRLFFTKTSFRMSVLRFVYFFCPYAMALGYVLCLIVSAGMGKVQLFRSLLGPMLAFLGVSVFRSLMDFRRPYEQDGIIPLIGKEKQGHSFPSRHAASAGVIATAWCGVSIPAGICFLILAVLISASRVAAGVHYCRDVVVGLAIGIICEWIVLIIF